mgnify:CR=1 FL=1
MQRSRRAHRGLLSASRVTLATCLAFAATALQAQDDPFGESWPAGEGRELSGAWCGGCHSLNLVRQQGLTHDGWDELLHWMTEKQNMPPLKGEQRSIVLDYLATNFGTDGRGGSVGMGRGDTLESLTPVQGISRPLLEIRPREGAG